MNKESNGIAGTIEAGYAKAENLHGASYAAYLREHDAELAANGYAPRPWPESLAGNDGI